MKRYPKCDCGQVSKFHFINDHDHVFGQYELVNGRERLYENVGVNDDGDDYYFCKKCSDTFLGYNTTYDKKEHLKHNDIKFLDTVYLDRVSGTIDVVRLKNGDKEGVVYLYNRGGEFIVYKTLQGVFDLITHKNNSTDRIYDSDNDEAVDQWLLKYKFWGK